MAKIKVMFEALLIFMTGVLFSYFTYPFFNSLISALDGLDGTPGFEEWGTISGLAWVGYFVIMVLWIIAWPAWLLFQEEQPQ